MIKKLKSFFIKNSVKKTPLNQNIFNPSLSSGINLTVEGSLTVATVYACVRIIAETIASLPLKIYQHTNEGKKIAKHPLNYLLGSVSNSDNTAFELREFNLLNLCLRGNSFTQVVRRNGHIISLEPLNAKYMQVDRDSRDNLIYDYGEIGNSRVFKKSEIWRVAGLSSNGITGISPITLARESIGLSLVSERSAASMFKNGAQIPGILEYPHAMNDEGQIERLRQQFIDNQSGHNNAHKPLLLESGMSYKTIGMSADDAQFLESRKFQIAEIARWFKIPLHMLNELDKATFSNIEHQSIEFVRDTVRPWLIRIEQTISRDLLTTNEREKLFPKHTVEGLLRGDIKARYESYGMAIRDGWLSRNEVRDLENRNKEENLDEYLIPLNMASLGEIQNSSKQQLISAIAAREKNVVKAEIEKLTEEEFKKWVPVFYHKRHKVFLQSLNFPQKKIREYVAMRIERLTDNPIESIPNFLKNAEQDIEVFFYE